MHVLLCNQRCKNGMLNYDQWKSKECLSYEMFNVLSGLVSGLWKTHVLCNRVRTGRSRSSKVVDFRINRKGASDLLLVFNSNLGPILTFSEIRGLIHWKLRISPIHSHLLTPSLGVSPLEFQDELFTARTRVLGLFVYDDFVILACVVLSQCQRVTDRQTDRQTEGWTEDGRRTTRP